MPTRIVSAIKMIRSYHSKQNKEILLHQSVHINNLAQDLQASGRVNISHESESLQSAVILLVDGQTFKPHRHITYVRDMPMAQESWVVIQGSVKVTYYDLDDSILEEVILCSGDSTITYRGGHNYLALEDNTLVYELKTGPYLGQAHDKVFI
jgi:cupin fold WbuC family metalloprotein